MLLTHGSLVLSERKECALKSVLSLLPSVEEIYLARCRFNQRQVRVVREDQKELFLCPTPDGIFKGHMLRLKKCSSVIPKFQTLPEWSVMQ